MIGDLSLTLMPRPLAVFATRGSRGRFHPDDETSFRSVWTRDRDRIIHSGAFRRLKHKTQVFVEHEGDYYRTRLTHSIEVAQIARTLARALGLEEDLAEAVALAHDLGHPPFGHAGERALDRLMQPYGGFDHNAQALRIVTQLECRYAGFDGLNLSWETLEGIAKHNGPLLAAGEDPARLPESIRMLDRQWPLALSSHASAEAQVAAIADDIAYNHHDLDDGLRAGLFTPADLREVALVGEAFAAVDGLWPGLDATRRNHEALRRVFTAMMHDVLAEAQRNLARLNPVSADDIRHAGWQFIGFSVEMRSRVDELRQFLFRRMYRHTRVNRMMSKARRVVEELFTAFMTEPVLLPEDWRRDLPKADASRARVVADYIAGMTDRYALEEHRKIMDPHYRA